jgi:hypothetical protein
VESINKRLAFQAGLDKKQDPSSKITRTKKAGGIAEAVESLPNKCKALSSKPSTVRKKKQMCLGKERAYVNKIYFNK